MRVEGALKTEELGIDRLRRLTAQACHRSPFPEGRFEVRLHIGRGPNKQEDRREPPHRVLSSPTVIRLEGPFPSW